MPECPTCGQANPDAARFCNACGAALTLASTAATAAGTSTSRRTVTVVFCDVTGSTGLGERLDPESLRAVMARYFETMRAVVERHGGTVEKFIGDAVMAVFGIPRLHEDDAARAVRAAAEMREALGVLNTELARDRGVTIATRIGVNTGQVVTGDLATSPTLVTGDAVNVAARLEQSAAPGEVLIGPETYALVRDLVVVETVEPLDLRGRAAAVDAYRLLQVTPGTFAPERPKSSPMLGRARELLALEQAFDRVTGDSACGLFTVLGVAGEGKSRLVDEFVDRLDARATVLRGRCPPYGEGITYAPVVDAVRELLALSGSESPDVVAERLRAALDGDEQRDVLTARMAEVLGVATGRAATDETHWAVRRFLEVVAAEHPLVVVVDDLQWAEPTLLLLVDHITELSRDAPILLVCMARPELLDLRPDWGGGKLSSTTILLKPLDADESGLLVRNLLGAELDDELRTRVTAAAEGNPLFLEQLLSMLVDDGLLTEDDGTWRSAAPHLPLAVPPTIASLLAARLDRLDPDERIVVEVASVVGQWFPSAAVRALAPGAEVDVDHVLQRLSRKELVRTGHGRPGVGELRFSHLLVRDAAYEAVPKGRRATLHAQYADWLEAASGAGAEDQGELVGYHLEQAYRLRTELGPLTDADRALGERGAARLAASGRRALALDDMPATANLLARAAALMPVDDPARIALLAEVGYALAQTGQHDRASEVLAQAAASPAAAADEQLLAHVWLRQLDSDTVPVSDGTDDQLDQVIALMEQAGDERGLARAWRLRGSVEWDKGLFAPVEAALEHALRHARRAGEPHDEAQIIESIGFLLARGPTPVDDAVAQCQDILASTTSRAAEAYLSHPLAHLLARRGDFDEARRRCEVLLSYLRDTGQTWSYQFFSEVVADVEGLAGNTDEAIRALTEGAEQLDRMGARTPSIEGYLAHHLLDAGQFEAADAYARYGLATADDDFLTKTLALGVHARVLARDGSVDEAVRLATEGVALIEVTDFLVDQATALADLAEVLTAAGRNDEARAALERALDASTRKGDLVNAERTRATLAQLTSG